MKNLTSLLINPEILCKDMLRILNSNGSRILIVVDKENSLLGTITDGDIRRGLLKGLTLSNETAEFMNTNPSFHKQDNTIEESKAIMRLHDLIGLPIVDDSNTVVDLRLLNKIDTEKERPETVIIMAGGFGKRLKELTADKPKPMVEINNKPMLEHLLVNLISHGFRDFKISVHYLSNQIKDYFGDGKAFGVKIQYLEEKEPLGTAGCLFLAKDTDISVDFVLLNGDLLTNIDFEELIEAHLFDQNSLTIATKIFEAPISFGVLKSNGSRVQEIQEKPSFFHEISGGIYVLKRDLLDRFVSLERKDMPELIEELINSEERVGRFPIVEYWKDLGTQKDLEEAYKEILSV
ncbi:sugar phosphate nucleotidyltransferase [Gammaproteobacteria bacterium]|nr:sugar phosphate nucleotidyltransferase [Gammaproteobacteria bacterium]